MRARRPSLIAILSAVLVALAACTPAPRTPGAPAPAEAGRAATAPVAAEAAPPDEGAASFYRGKTVRIVVGFPPGGGYDTYARAIARYLGQYVPGNPTVIVDNMPGAGSLVAANHVYNVAPKDGTVIVLFSGAAVGQQLFGAPEIRFDATRFYYLGVPVGDTAVVHLHRRAGVTSFEQLVGPNAKEIVLGGSAAGSLNVDAATLLRDVLGANIKLVTGYAGSAPIRLAIEAGELDGSIDGWESIRITSRDEVESGTQVLVAQITDRPHKDLPQVPTIADIARTDEQRQLLLYGQTLPNRFLRPFALAPGVPTERAQALREAFAKVFADADFRAEAERGKLLLDPLTGEELERMIQDYLSMPPDLAAKLKKLLLPS
jgi:tripartite-type tricarboxylate transporter receptor subunit TctC